MGIKLNNERIRKKSDIVYSSNIKMNNLLIRIIDNNILFVNSDEDMEKLENIIRAMSIVDRKYFVNKIDVELSYLDLPLQIGENQTISQPSTVARMLYLLDLKKGDNVLEVGTGSGWNSALIGFLIYNHNNKGKVNSYEKFSSLATKAENNLDNLKYHISQKNPKYNNYLSNVKIIKGNIFEIYNNGNNKQYDKIIFTAGIKSDNYKDDIDYIEGLALNLLNDNGKIILPKTLGKLIIYSKDNNRLKEIRSSEEYSFVPLERD